jgi:hypothetical protein
MMIVYARGAVRLLLIAWSRQNLAPHRWLVVLLISQTFPNLTLVGTKVPRIMGGLDPACYFRIVAVEEILSD